MRNQALILLICSAICAPATSIAACNTEPATELRNAFIQQYAGRGAQKGAAIDKTAGEAGYIFDVMAENLTVKGYIKAVSDSQAGRKMGPDMERLLPTIRKTCLHPG